MRNKVKRNNTRRFTAVLLMLLMLMGSFSAAAFAQEVPEQNAAEAAETAPAESAASGETQTPAAEMTQPAAAEQPSAGSSQPESNSTSETEVSQAGSDVMTGESVPAEENMQAADVQAADDAQTEAAQTADDAQAAEVSGDAEAPAKSPAQSQTVRSEARAAAAGTHDVKFNFDKLPGGMSVAFNIGNKKYTYDGSVITDITDPNKYITITDPVIAVAAGSALTVSYVSGLTDDYQQGSSPGSKSTKQLKLVLKDSSGKELQRVSLNNSSTQTSTSVSLDNVASAVIGIANRIRYSTSTDVYHRVMSTSIVNMNNLGQTQSELGDIFAMEGDKISFDDDSESYERLDISLTDAAGKSVAFSGGSFIMPSSMVTLNMVCYYKARSVNVKNLAPERGTISIKKDKYHPGDKVVIKIRSNSGYKFNTKTLAYLYQKDGKWVAQKITKDEDGKYSFIMPFYDIDIRGTFVAKETAAESSDSSAYIEYADGEDEEEEPEPEEEEENAEEPELTDIMPIVTRAVSETVFGTVASLGKLKF